MLLANWYTVHIQGKDHPVVLTGAWENILEQRTAEDSAIEILRLLWKRQQIAVAVTFLTGLFCAATFIAIAIAATTTSLITLDNNALSTNIYCGIWVPNADVRVVNPMGQIMIEVEEIQRACYENESPEDCGLFPYSDLFVNVTEHVDCPFVGSLCLGGNNSAVRFETGYRDSTYLGLNSPNRPIYRRTSTCAPLTADKFTNITFDATTNFTTIAFRFGPKIDTDDPSTYTITRSPTVEQLFTPTGYDLKTSSSILGYLYPDIKFLNHYLTPPRDFKPIPDLASANGDPTEYPFVMFMNTFKVHYPNISNDPIFPAKTRTLCPRSNETCWNNTILPSSVLGCTERAEVCYPDSDHCFDVWAPKALDNMLSANWTGAEEIFLTMLGLSYSNFGDLLSTRHGLLLNATQRIIGNRLSQALDPYQWKLEVKRLFYMGLLRAKMEMLAVVRGTRANNAGYQNILPASRRDICQKVKFQAKGYTNISFLGLLLAILLPLIFGFEIRKHPPTVWVALGVRQLFRLVQMLGRMVGSKSHNGRNIPVVHPRPLLLQASSSDGTPSEKKIEDTVVMPAKVRRRN